MVQHQVVAVRVPEERHVTDARVEGLAEELDFRTMGNERKVIAAWLVRDIEGSSDDDLPGNTDSVNRRSKRQEDDSSESNRQEAVP